MKTAKGKSKKAKPRITASGVPVWCAHDEIADIGDLKPRPDNPNTHPEEQVRLLSKIIMEQGWRAPITVSLRSGLITKGHGRRLAAIAAGLEQAPVDYQHYGSDAEEMADVLADNRIPELAEMDAELVEQYLKELKELDFDVDLAGFDQETLDWLFGEAEPSGGESQEIKEKYEVLVIELNEKEQRDLLEKLSAEGWKCKALIS